MDSDGLKPSPSPSGVPTPGNNSTMATTLAYETPGPGFSGTSFPGSLEGGGQPLAPATRGSPVAQVQSPSRPTSTGFPPQVLKHAPVCKAWFPQTRGQEAAAVQLT